VLEQRVELVDQQQVEYRLEQLGNRFEVLSLVRTSSYLNEEENEMKDLFFFFFFLIQIIYYLPECGTWGEQAFF
jgi:hypothetical protein